MINLKELGLKEVIQSNDVNGGICATLAFILGACAGGLLWDIVANPKETAAAWEEGRDMVFNE